MSKFIFFISFLMSFTACVDELPELGSENFCAEARDQNDLCLSSQSARLGFKSEDYIYDEDSIEFINGKVSLKKIDFEYDHEDFNQGSHSNTAVIDNKLTIAANSSQTHVNKILPERSSSLRALWRFEGNINDELNAFNASSAGSPSFISGKNGQGVNLNNTSGDYLILEENANNLANYTVSFWFRHKSGSGVIFHRGASNTCTYTPKLTFNETNSEIHFSFSGCGGAGNVGRISLNSDQWYHITVSQTTTPSKTQKIYIDGVEVISSNVNVGGYSNKAMVLGVVNTSTGPNPNTLNADYDELAYWNTPLTAHEIETIYKAQSEKLFGSTKLSSSWTPKWDNIVAYWSLDGALGDVSGNGHHGAGYGGITYSNDAKVGNYAPLLDGVDDYSEIATSPNLTGFSKMTTSFWIYTRGGSDYNAGIVDKNRLAEWSIHLAGGNNKIMFDAVTANGIERWQTNTTLNNYSWYHIAVIYDSESLKREIYIDGNKATLTYSANDGGAITATNNPVRIGNTHDDRFLSAKLNDLALFNNALTAYDIQTIYNRQKQKYAGQYKSKILNFQSDIELEKLNITTNLPYFKELSINQETQDSYQDITGNLTQNLVAYWDFNESTINSGEMGSDITDKTQNNNHGNIATTASLGEKGLFGNSAKLNHNNSETINFGSDPTLDFSGDFTVSSWVYLDSYPSTTQGYLISKGNYSGSGWALAVIGSSNGCGSSKAGYLFFSDGNSGHHACTSKPIPKKQWAHILLRYQGNTVNTYINGELVAEQTSVNVDFDSSMSLILGARSPNNWFLSARIDEVAIWDRALLNNEIQQLYRRGANRIKYQLRVCLDENCSTEPEWIGPGGNSTTFFSELFNRSSSQLTNIFATCDADSICTEDEINLTGNIQAKNPEFSFLDTLTQSYTVLKGQYIQYQILLESDDSEQICSNEACLPSLSKMTFSSNNSYYTSAPSITSKYGIKVDDKIIGLKESVYGGCSIKYQFSKDGSTFYYFDQNWVLANNTVDEANSASEIGPKLSSFIQSGEIYLKAFLKSNGAQACQIESIEFLY